MLQDVGGQGTSNATAINASGQSVGYSFTATGEDTVLWSSSGTATNLSAVLGPAWSDTTAVGLNDRGDILGYGTYNGGQYGFLLTPVPELSTWAMLLVGFVGLGFAGYRKAMSTAVAA
ncbi:MAG TPA: hypothetical protein VFE60_20830 [Roseiarcus sp.]|nr:hypothetical protein [Roseiarcus sp.]